MFFKAKFSKYYYIKIKNSTAPLYWLLLHGFMGTHKEFLNVATQLPGTIIIPDLLGHGQSDVNNDTKYFSIEQQADDLVALSKQITTQRVNIWGYSMGGRLALALALRYPEIVNHLYLESSTAGIKSPAARQARITNDHNLALRLQTATSLTDFVDFWENLPLFHSQKDLSFETQAFVRNQRLQQSGIGLAKSLCGMGTGKMPNYWNQLPFLQSTTTLFAGELDTKFSNITRDMQLLIPNSKRVVIPGVGHNVHLENPNAILTTILQRKYL
ncbi:2-succinyl-6-hydroxy-2,4-cyclohexadiene-1-carboxylate synthase [Liquorilactobacillus hordei]|uniref:Putative 2-succinyl-6-hydroxy-2,4-cyclohexadiene-1-carboxylate synthase n=2 Tax=Liquorilactobacillus hordei TaxID=468911 RepID=A0A3S6QMI2_9LACO|nr:2-succinyl-6-hydroxy-2,4-cyclohexadiene-1-carboxylate synthase [Liquorilactobacillus hordei]AUJ28809.1 2-succinyl-6-hydroxy-2,4-cyclohexadiene-1-carboxylate synthase [Liquorilactobacillus hordei]MBZ2406213.1 2-succinyl-6-hydroxy-2,4-cyclohexadiene-1-carboxylate synthase [Liquorilactobacillus hordei]